jgi:dihydroneopterin triphosphate diphosphatase
MKIPISVLVVIYTASNEVLLLERKDHPGFWQSVTGSLDTLDEPPIEAAARELFEETGIDASMLPPGSLQSMNQQIQYEIYPQWRHRYAEGVTQNTEHWFKLLLPNQMPVTLSPREHLAYQWQPIEVAATLCFSPSNQQAILKLNSD